MKHGRYTFVGWIALAAFSLAGTVGAAVQNESDWRELVASGQLVEIQKYDRTIKVEMRYATTRNCTGEAIYPADFPCLTRPETAARLHAVQQMLHLWGYRLKIWDAYRPQEAQDKLWRRWAKRGFVANPREGPGSLHTWGLAVDVTMVDLLGRDVAMPSGFDEFSPQASAIYKGDNKRAAFHLQLLQSAMSTAGFEGLSTEWWHFAVRDWPRRRPLAIPGKSNEKPPKPSDAPDFVVKPAAMPTPKPRAGS